MSNAASAFDPYARSEPQTPAPAVPHIPIVPLGTSLGLFFALSFALCVLFDLWFPTLAMNSAWAPLLPGFVWISWSSFFLGLAETFAYGWFVAVTFGPIFNWFAARQAHGAR